MTFDYTTEFDRYVERVKVRGDETYKVIVDTHAMYDVEVSQRYTVDEDISDKVHQMNEDYYNHVISHLKHKGVIQ